MNIRFVVPGTPQGKARPRFAKNGHAYTERKTSDYEKQIRACYLKQVGGHVIMPDQPIMISITAVFKVNKSDSKKIRDQKLSGIMLPTKKPDCDNIAKVICDALSGVAYKDDKQIVDCHVVKIYGISEEVDVIITVL